MPHPFEQCSCQAIPRLTNIRFPDLWPDASRHNAGVQRWLATFSDDMDISDFPERAVSTDGSDSCAATAENNFRAVIVYQDEPTQLWAAEMWERVTRLIGNEGIDVHCWAIGDLAHPRLFAHAVQATAEADVVIISAKVAEDLPLNLYVWIDAWLPRRKIDEGALVTLLSVSEEFSGASARALAYFQAIAARARMNFLPEERKFDLPERNPTFMDEMHTRAVTVTPILGDILSRGREGYRDWGINE